MANRTVNREPMEVSIPSNSAGFFNTAQFKGLCDNRNEVSIDQQTFAAMENMFVSDNDVLTSRPPLRFYDDKTNIIYEWYFGQFGFRVYKYFREYTDTGYKTLETLEGADLENTYLYYKLECITHELVMNPDEGQYNYMSWAIKYTEAGVDAIPKITPAQIEDKIYFWFADVTFVCYNVVGNYFEQAEKYVYVPVTDLVTNGITSSLESNNYLTETHKKRYLYSTVSGINFQQMGDKRVSVSLNSEQTQNSSKHLYDTTLNPNSKDTLIYPYSQIGNGYIIDMVETTRAIVILRYSLIFDTIEVSFDGSSWRNLPVLQEIVGNPCLTKDGLSAVAFTRTGLAMCKLVAQDSDDFVPAESFSWVIHNYCRYAQETTGQGVVIDEINTTMTPRGDFMTSDQFCYVVWVEDDGSTTGFPGYLPVMYSEWLAGTSGVQSAFYSLNYNADGAGAKWRYLMNDDYNIKFKYVTPTPDNKTAAPVISLMTPFAGVSGSSTVCAAIYAFIYKREDNQRPILEHTAQLLLDSEGKSYHSRIFVSPCENFDYVVSDPTYSGDKITFTLYAAYNQLTGTYNQLTGTDYVPQDVYSIISFTNKNAEDTTYTRTVIPKLSNQFKMKQNGTDYITDQYLYIGGEIVELPKNGELSQYVDDDKRSLVSGDNLVVFNYFNSAEIVLSGKAMKAKDGKSTAGIIRSGDRVLMDVDDNDNYLFPPDNYLIQHMANDGSNNWTIISGPLNISTLVRLRSSATSYPAAPTDWTLGDDWPITIRWEILPKPLLIDIETGEYREWKAGDALPSGFVNYWGKLGIERIVTPLCYGSLGTWYVIDGTLWRSSLQSNISLELDELLDATSDGLPKMNYTTPDHFMQLSEYFFSFVNPDGRFLLEVTETRRDVEKLFSEEGRDFLLYLPKSNEQPFSQKITNLHPISDASMGVFTDNEIYYVSPVELNTGKVAYTAPVKSKIPLGCRDGSDVVTALDGQVILFSAPKGIAAMEPQDFVATTERTIKYLSDAIQSEYTHFYNDIIPSARLMPWDDSAPKGYDPMIKIATYKYWLIFYRYMYNVCLAFDTRTGTWWKWSTQYPIIKVDVGERLHFIQQIDFNPTEQLEIVFPPPKLPLYGRNFVWCDREIENNSIAYLDDIVAGALDGNVYKDNGGRNIFKYAEPIIRWSFTSQRLHFGQINNYKLIKAINMSAQGDSVMTAKLTTKAFRDYYHPEKSEVVEIKISDLRTYIRRMNIMHCVYFQYSLSNDVAVDTQAQLRLNSLSVKYEPKERVR